MEPYYVAYDKIKSFKDEEKMPDKLELYKYLREFRSEPPARKFALDNCLDGTILLRGLTKDSEVTPRNLYLAIAEQQQKEYGTTEQPFYRYSAYEVKRMFPYEVDSTIDKLIEENPRKIYFGIEEELKPSALDKIRCLNNRER